MIRNSPNLQYQQRRHRLPYPRMNCLKLGKMLGSVKQTLASTILVFILTAGCAEVPALRRGLPWWTLTCIGGARDKPPLRRGAPVHAARHATAEPLQLRGCLQHRG